MSFKINQNPIMQPTKKLRTAHGVNDVKSFNSTLKQLQGEILSYQQALGISKYVESVFDGSSTDTTWDRRMRGERFLEILKVDSSHSKLTVNPNTGRVTLKSSVKASDVVFKNHVRLATKLLTEELPLVTFRGKIGFYNGIYECLLQSESKKFSHQIQVKEEL